MRNPFHSDGPKFDLAAELKKYRQQLQKEYGDSIPARIWITILVTIKSFEIENSEEQNRKNYLKI